MGRIFLKRFGLAPLLMITCHIHACRLLTNIPHLLLSLGWLGLKPLFNKITLNIESIIDLFDGK
jgi:hypothetical protein